MSDATTIDDLIANARAGMVDGLPAHIAEGAAGIGIWGRLRNGSYRLSDLDRVELYRPLTADPKDARRRRAAKPP